MPNQRRKKGQPPKRKQKERALTANQKAFADAYVRDGSSNASAAYREAYPSSKKWKPESVWPRASELLSDRKVAARVADLQAKQEKIAREKLEMDTEKLLQLLVSAATTDPAVFYNDDLTPKRLDQIPADKRQLITHIQRKHGKEQTIELRLFSREKAIDSIARIVGAFEKDNKQKAEQTVTHKVQKQDDFTNLIDAVAYERSHADEVVH